MNRMNLHCPLAGMLAALLLSACGTTMTEDERIAYEYERVERANLIREFIWRCEQAKRTVIYTGPSYNKLRDPVQHPPNHARVKDYFCVSQEQVSRAFGVGG